jgi:hypothetical protein
MPDHLEERIRTRAHQLWREEGRPDGRAEVHWEQARILVAIEDDRTSLKPVTPEQPEPAEVMKNLGEFPTATTDQGDRQQYPSRAAEMPP